MVLCLLKMLPIGISVDATFELQASSPGALEIFGAIDDLQDFRSARRLHNGRVDRGLKLDTRFYGKYCCLWASHLNIADPII